MAQTTHAVPAGAGYAAITTSRYVPEVAASRASRISRSHRGLGLVLRVDADRSLSQEPSNTRASGCVRPLMQVRVLALQTKLPPSGPSEIRVYRNTATGRASSASTRRTVLERVNVAVPTV